LRRKSKLGPGTGIVADGRVDLYPFGGERRYISTPDGIRPGARRHSSVRALLRARGECATFVVGKKLRGRVAAGRGKLYLPESKLAPGAWCPAAGQRENRRGQIEQGMTYAEGWLGYGRWI